MQARAFEQPILCRVLERRNESADTFSFRLQTPDWYRFEAGQFNMLYAFGAGESAISISSDPEIVGELWHTIRVVGRVTKQLSQLKVGDAVPLRGPFGKSWPWQTARGKQLLIVAGGIGLAPLRPVIYRAVAAPQDFQSVTVLVGARSPGELLYADEHPRWQQHLRVMATVDRADSDWHGSTGVVTRLIERLELDADNVCALLCGPEVMMRFAARGLIEQGVAPSDLHLSLERNMKCAVARCGHCQLGPHFICKDGPVFPYPSVVDLMRVREL